MPKKRRTFSAEFKAKVGLEALRGVAPVHVIAQRHEVHPVQVSAWKKKVMRVDPDDQNDICFLATQIDFSMSSLKSALSRVVIPPVPEIAEAFSMNRHWLGQRFGV